MIVAAAAALLLLWVIWTYNRLVRLRNEREQGWANIDVQLRRRFDLVPNLVETVQSYATHERELFEEVTRARAAAGQASGPRSAGVADEQLGQQMGKLIAVAEAYPELRASENFLALQQELADIEDKVAAARRYYNVTVLRLNTLLQSFPTLIVGNAFRFQLGEPFGIEDAERAVPNVQLSTP